MPKVNGGRLRERRRVEPPVQRLLARWQFRIGDEIGVCAQPRGDAVAGGDAADDERTAARKRADAAEAPAANHMCEPSVIQPALARTDGEFPDEIGADDVGAVVFGDGLRFAQIVGIDHDAAAAAEPLRHGIFFAASLLQQSQRLRSGPPPSLNAELSSRTFWTSGREFSPFQFGKA